MPTGFIKARNVKRRTGNVGDQYGLAYYFNQGEKLKQARQEAQNKYQNDLMNRQMKERQFAQDALKTKDTHEYRKARMERLNRLDELKREEAGIEKATRKLKALSTEYSSVYDPTGVKFQNYQTSDQGKETIKDLKKNLPEQFDEKGNIILIKNHDLIKDQLKDKADALQSRIPQLQNLLRDPSLPPLVRKHYEDELKKDITEAIAFSTYKDPDLFAKAIDIAQNDTDSWNNKPDSRGEMIDANYKMLAGAKMDSIGGFPGSVEQAPQAQQQNNWPSLGQVMGGGGGVSALAGFLRGPQQQTPTPQAPPQANIQIPQQSGDVQNPQGQQVNSAVAYAQSILAKRKQQ